MSENFLNFVTSIESVTKNTARFRKVVLHTHSPQSHDFPRVNSDHGLNDKNQYLSDGCIGEDKFIQHLIGRYDIVGITDHMHIGYGCRLAENARKRNDICILPGIELALRLAPPLHEMKIHAIALFSEEKTIGEIERIFPPRIKADDQRDGSEEIRIGMGYDFPDIPSFIKQIDNNMGFCIAAHVDSNQGIRYLFRQTGRDILELFSPDESITTEQEKDFSEKFKDFLVFSNFHGIEVSKPSDRQHYSWISKVDGQKKEVPVFLTFDAHSIEELSNDKRSTYVKTTDLSWQGLRNAIKFPGTRIRFFDDRVPPPHVLGLEIINPGGTGFFSDVKLGFSENLTSIIGPRGSGKSTIIDAMRYVFGYNRSLSDLENPDLMSSVINRQKTNLQQSIIRILYRSQNSEVHVLEATYDHKSDYATRVYDLEGKSIPIDDVEASGYYPLRLFGWSEIETLGRDPRRQLELLDKLIDNLSGVKEEKTILINQLTENRQKINQFVTQLNSLINQDEKEIRKYKEYQREFDTLNTEDVNDLFEEYDKEKENLKFLHKLLKAISNIHSYLTNTNFTELDEIINSAEDDLGLSKWWKIISEKYSIAKKFTKTKKNINAEITSLSSINTVLDELIKISEETLREIESEIRGKVSADPSKQVLTDLRNQAKERLEKVELQRDLYNKAYNEFLILIEIRNGFLIQLMKYHRKVSKLRELEKKEIIDRLNEFQTNDMEISLELQKDGNKDEFLNFLNDFPCLSFASRIYKSRKWPEIISFLNNPIRFSHILLKKRADSIVFFGEVEGKECYITLEEANKVIEFTNPYSYDELAEIHIIDWNKLDSILKLQEINWDDKERILRNGQPVDKSSPGQRSSAMLPLIALAESVPLIIDQPEDNLDNRLVGKVLVEILAKLKEKRQIIVSTHNPNIVVLGDSEQVIVLDAIDDKHGCVTHQASIDDPIIIKNVIDLMEGGRDAFETRNKRYFGNIEPIVLP
jgi:DNA repair ATPase RecN